MNSKEILGGDLRFWSIRCLAILLLIAPMAAYFKIPARWDTRGKIPVTGDEPNYLIVADAIAVDHSLDVKNAYDRDAQDLIKPRIYGGLDWWTHTKSNSRGLFSIHNLGIPVLVALPFKLSGLAGARATMAIFACLFPLAFFCLARLWGIGTLQSSALAFFSSIGLPYAAASGQIYPDLPSGALLLTAFSMLVAQSQWRGNPRLRCAALAIPLALLPWLHIKNVFASLAMALFFSTLVLGKSTVNKKNLAIVMLVDVSLIVSLALLMAYNSLAFDNVFGPYSGKDIAVTINQVVMIFLGLHFDQVQGIFVQQPFFLAGMIGLAWFLFEERWLGLLWCLTYLSIAVSNAAHPCWYGCFSIAGRFMWSIAGFWFLPLIHLYSKIGFAGKRLLMACGAFSLVIQYLYRNLWFYDPLELYFSWTRTLADRNSLLPVTWRKWFPSFYDFSNYWNHGPNVVALLLALLLIGLGVSLWVRNPSSTAEHASPSPGRVGG